MGAVVVLTSAVAVVRGMSKDNKIVGGEGGSGITEAAVSTN